MARFVVPLLLLLVVVFVVVATNPVFDVVPSSLETPTTIPLITETETTIPVFTSTFTPTSTAIPSTTPTLIVQAPSEVAATLALDTVDFVKILALHRVRFPNKLGPVVKCQLLPGSYPRLVLPNWQGEWDIFATNLGYAQLVGLYESGAEYCLAPSITSPRLNRVAFEQDDNFSDFEYIFKSDDMCGECDIYILLLGPALEGFSYGEWHQEETGWNLGYSTNVPRKITLAWNILGFVADGTMPQEKILNVNPAQIILVLPANYSALHGLNINGSGWSFEE